MGKPDNPEEYVAIQVGEWGRRYGTVYVPRELWQLLPPVSHEVSFYMQNYGRCCLTFDVPIGRLKV